MESITLALVLLAHSWYPVTCCSDVDKECQAISASRVVQQSDGSYLVDGRYRSPTAGVSPDDDYHACISSGTLWCFWAPQGTT